MLSPKELRDNILRLAMTDTVRNSQYVLPLVMFLEVYMTISWFVSVNDKMAFSSLCYLAGYILLFTFSAMVLAFIFFAKKRLDQNYRYVNYVQMLLAFVFMAWAIGFTYVGSELRGNFDYLIFVTFVTLLPLFCYLNPIYWTALQLIGTGFMFFLGSHHDRFFAFFVNFTVFTLISVAAGWTLHYIRRSGYLRQIELEQERNHAYTLAHIDTLTKLPNRQSCREELERLKTDPDLEKVIILVCDVNGLKTVNDQLGHRAGDELIQGAALCLRMVFGKVGSIYRIGGDEFVAIIQTSEGQLHDLVRTFKRYTSNWRGKYSKQLSVAIGHASVAANPDTPLPMILTLADNEMYEAKRQYYKMKIDDR